MRRRSKKFLFTLALVLFLTSYISSSLIFAYLRDVYLPEIFYFVTNLMPDDITCYRDNSTSIVSDISKRFDPNSIFFYQTNCENTLSLRAACAIETASRLHENQKVYVIFATQPDLTNIVIKELLKLGNVYLTKGDIKNKYAESTPFSNTAFLDIVKKERRLYKIIADFLKLMTLYEHGGTVLDMDILLAKSLSGLGKNWVLRSNSGYSMAAMKLSNDSFGKSIAGTIIFNYRRYAHFGYLNGEKALQDALKKLCNISYDNNLPGTCRGLKIYNRAIFEPISFNKRYLYMEPVYNLEALRGYHTWDTGVRKAIPVDSMYANLARTYCPRIFSTFMYDFVSDY